MALNTSNYTGGLPQKNRELAQSIRDSFLEQYLPENCAPIDPDSGYITSITNAEEEFANVSIDNVSAPLRPLIFAFNDNSQEVRDTAAYTMGLFGRSGAELAPFLGKRFAANQGDDRIKGDWHSDAYGKVICERIASANFSQVLPDHLLPNSENYQEFLNQSAILMATLYLDPDIEYPPGMMGGEWGNFAITRSSGDAAPLFVQILESDDLSIQKKREAAFALNFVENEKLEFAREVFVHHSNTKDLTLKRYITKILVKLNDLHVIPILIERISPENFHWDWEDDLCAFGENAIAAESRLIDALQDKRFWPADQRAAVRLLGCLRSEASIPALLTILEFPDWETQEAVIISLAYIGKKDRYVIDALGAIYRTHWSEKVRRAAEFSIELLNANAEEKDKIRKRLSKLEGDRLMYFLVQGPQNHGLVQCEKSARYSINGEDWFHVSWIEPGLPPVPDTLPEEMFWDHGTRQFFEVQDGWLFGADHGHYDGYFRHIAHDAQITELDTPGNTDILGFVKLDGKIYAFGYQVLKGGDGGSLFEVFQAPNGAWKSRRIAALPSRPLYYSISPSGALLLSDGPNEYAFLNNEIAPLKCEKEMEKDFFEELQRRSSE